MSIPLALETLSETLTPATVLAWKPFLQPAPGVDRWWWLLIIPTALGISLAYKATRSVEPAQIPRDAARMSLQIIGAIAAGALFLYLLVIVLLPMLPAE
ncbi:MAG: hypothetical protein GC172_11250 [Phycisphaera sp.]|nr:hypothetical protein [Phycisphaera sp.]